MGPIFRRVCKITTGDCSFLHVCLSVRMQQLDSHWTDFREIISKYFFFRKSLQKIKFSLKFDNNNRYIP